ncbi:peptide ligase PGM1-related protein [Rhodococcus sp. AQ5-07]|uniref:preATP grasp domain-containing protein n=1 Tax=Rhodococcus sp. AQ5-07 TaxID=2054902 RepID=UPI0012B6172B|nr:peptide ligase PGM1-related protein [Rhodococcus sp. AQ5-07]
MKSVSGFPAGMSADGDTSCRFVWHVEEGDVLVVPEFKDAGHIANFCRLTGISASSFRVLEADYALSDKELASSEFQANLKQEMRGLSTSDEWSMYACVVTPGIVQLADALAVPRPLGSGFALEGGVDLINLKSTFRRFAAGSSIPRAEGVVVRTEFELTRAVKEILPLTGMAILKQDRSGGGHGNIGLTWKSSNEQLPGTRVTERVSAPEIADLCSSLWAAYGSPSAEGCLVLESFERSDTRFFFEFNIDDTSVNLVDSGMIRYAAVDDENSSADCSDGASPRWVGLDLWSTSDAGLASEAQEWCERYLNVIRILGYRGFVNMDGLVTLDGRLIFHEINARWGGSLVYHETARRLTSDSYRDRLYVRSELGTVPVAFPLLLDLLERESLAFSSATGSGIVALAGWSDLGGGTETLILADSEKEVVSLTEKLRAGIDLLNGPK